MKIRQAYVYNVPSATFHYTRGDDYVYLNFVDRNSTIKYKRNSKTGRDLISRIKRYGYVKTTYAQ
jgi:hypothetical protein